VFTNVSIKCRKSDVSIICCCFIVREDNIITSTAVDNGVAKTNRPDIIIAACTSYDE